MILPLLLSASSLSVPFVSQHKDTCGAAALAMVLRYWSEDVTQEDVARALVRPELHGIAGSQLAEFARSRGSRGRRLPRRHGAAARLRRQGPAP
jgi:ABC-type bacteriocin/lantibiotic exporter with double-glycine peptidase domain